MCVHVCVCGCVWVCGCVCVCVCVGWCVCVGVWVCNWLKESQVNFIHLSMQVVEVFWRALIAIVFVSDSV